MESRGHNSYFQRLITIERVIALKRVVKENHIRFQSSRRFNERNNSEHSFDPSGGNLNAQHLIDITGCHLSLKPTDIGSYLRSGQRQHTTTIHRGFEAHEEL